VYKSLTLIQSFYSTQFVHRKEGPGGVHSIEYMENAWLFFAVSIPLTFCTLGVWYTWANYRRMYHALLPKQDEQKGRFIERMKSWKLLDRNGELPR
jgi:hypothetical protein